MATQGLIQKYSVISDQISVPALTVILDELEKILEAQVPGAIVEFGCYIGTTSLFIRRLLDGHNESAKREFHAYDSFEGLPPKGTEDQSAAGIDFKAGELKASRKQFLKEFHKANLQTPITHKAWFKDLKRDDLPEVVAFAFLDGDFYGSIIKSLELVWPRLSPGATVCIDDYGRETLPGVEQAVKSFFKNNIPKISVIQNIAVITSNE